MDKSTQPMASYNTYTSINNDTEPLDGSSVNISLGDNKKRIAENRKLNDWALFKNLKRTELALGCSVGVFLISCIILSAYIGVGCRRHEKDTEFNAKRKHEICEDSVCYEYAALQSKMLDKSIDPCEDIYKYSCGRFHENFPANPDEQYVNLKTMAAKKHNNEMRHLIEASPESGGASNQSAIYKTRKVFQSCLQNDLQVRSRCEENPIFDVISKVGGWKLLGTFNETRWSFTEAHKKIAIDFYFPTFFNFHIEPNEKVFTFSGTSNNIYSFIEEDASALRLHQNKHFIIEVTNMLVSEYYSDGCNISKPPGNQSSIEKFAEEVLEMETLLKNAKIGLSEDNGGMEHMTMDLAELSLLIPELELSTFIPELLGKQIKMRDEKLFMFEDRSYNISSVLKNANNSMKHSFLIWTVIKNLLPHVPGGYWQAYYQIRKELLGLQEIPPLWERCMTLLKNGPLDEVLTAMLIKDKFNEIAMNQINDVHANIRHVMSCQHSFIMDSENSEIHNIIHNMMNNFTITVGHNELLTNITKLEEYYSSLQVDETHAKNMINLNIFRREKIKDAFTSQELYQPSMADHIHSHETGNLINLNPHMYLLPFYDRRFPFFAIYASLGWSIAMTYIYPIVMKYHELGVLNAASEIQKEIHACLIDIINGTIHEGPLAVLDSDIEVLAIQILAAKAAFQAYQRHLHQYNGDDTTISGMQGLTHEQKFIVYFTQELSCKSFNPHQRKNTEEYGHAYEFSFNTILENLLQFKKIFNCSQPRNTTYHEKCNLLVADNISSNSVTTPCIFRTN